MSIEEALLEAGSRFLGREKTFLTLANILAIFLLRTVTNVVCVCCFFHSMCMYLVDALNIDGMLDCWLICVGEVEWRAEKVVVNTGLVWPISWQWLCNDGKTSDGLTRGWATQYEGNDGLSQCLACWRPWLRDSLMEHWNREQRTKTKNDGERMLRF